MKKFTTSCDMGNIKIFNKDMSCFFDNGVGDVETTVCISEKKINHENNLKFMGHFTVKTEAYLSSYDCSDTPIHTFKKGRWFVYLEKPAHFIIIKEDEDIHA